MNNRVSMLLKNKASLIPIFDHLGEGVLTEVFGISTIVKFNEDETVLQGGAEVEDIYIILSGKCVKDYLCAENKILKKEMGPADLFGIEALFLSGLRTNKVKAITELICLKIKIKELRANQALINSLTPNITRGLIARLKETNDQVSKFIEQIPEPDEIEEGKPSIIIDRNSMLTRILLSTGKVVVVSKIDERRLRRNQVSVEDLNAEYLSKINPEQKLKVMSA